MDAIEATVAAHIEKKKEEPKLENELTPQDFLNAYEAYKSLTRKEKVFDFEIYKKTLCVFTDIKPCASC